jgi:hypothetical protein
MPRDIFRFIVFGVRAQDDLLVEIHTDDFDNAVQQQDITSCADFKARIYDNVERAFVKPDVVEMARHFYNH